MESANETEEQGIACALGKICSLESRLRDAIQSTHSLHRSLGRDMGAVDRERTALLVIREHLEGLEDKLREYKTALSDPKLYDDKPITLSQMDTYRKELLRASRDRVDEVLFNKDVVKDILAFADTGAGDESLPEVPHDSQQSRPYSPSRSSQSSEGTDESAYTGDFSENGSYLTTSNPISPYSSRKDALSHFSTGEGQDNGFLYPVPASTPSVLTAQQSMDHPFCDSGIYFSHRPKEPASTRSSQQFDLGSELIAASRAHQQHAQWSTKPPRAYRNENDSSICGNQIHSKTPASFQGSCTAASQDTALSEAVPYGGKVSFKTRNQHQLQATQPVMPTSPVPKCEPPRVMNDPTYSEDSRLGSCEPCEEDHISVAVRQAASPIQPNRLVLEKRALQRSQELPRKRGTKLRALFLALIGVVTWPGWLVGQMSMRLNMNYISAGIIAATSAMVVSKAASHRDYAPTARFKPRRRPVRRSVSPRADGALVPDWMHKSEFKTSKEPPVGALTSTAGPPQGEMFPVIPPPSSRLPKG